ncbi:exosortase A [Sphingomonas aliaeris]|uniref:Exosortase A n=1 Tax=Sphingomonas aliaeris TaxID=2759526 RepID=A0A974S516_9SPHN|nr:exosortase A [Sphingomonas aliaeris]QQV78223.1 exosortase A [Sphingomonas aliaeris]
MTIALPADRFAVSRTVTNWQRHLAVLAGTTMILLLLFRRDVGDLTHIWWTSTTFGHCLFVAPVIGWLVWQRRAQLAELKPTSWWPGVILVAVGGFGWLLGDAASVALARHLGLVLMLQGAVLTILGPIVARGLLFPLCYAIFMVPFGEGLESPLQTITVGMTMPLLHLFDVPATVDGVLITIPNGYFEVAEACSGAKFVIAMIAYGTLVANVCFVSWRRRAVFMVVALVVPVIANGLRAFGTIYAAHLTSVERATGLDHIVYGWIFFGLVMAAVIGIGWRWFDRAPDDPAFDPARAGAVPVRRTDLLLAAALTLTVAAIFPAWGGIVASRAQVLPRAIKLPQIAGWHRMPMSTRAPWSPYYPGADHFLIGRYGDVSGSAVDLAIAVYGDQREGKELVSFGTGVLRQDDIWLRVADLPDLAGGSTMRITAPGPVERQVATWYVIGTVVTQDERVVKLETLRAKLLGGPQRAVAVHVSSEFVPGMDARAAMARFVATLGPLDRLVDRIVGTPPSLHQ